MVTPFDLDDPTSQVYALDPWQAALDRVPKSGAQVVARMVARMRQVDGTCVEDFERLHVAASKAQA